MTFEVQNCENMEKKLGLSCAKLRANLNLSVLVFLVWYVWFGMFVWFGLVCLVWYICFCLADLRLSSYLKSRSHLHILCHLYIWCHLQRSCCILSSCPQLRIDTHRMGLSGVNLVQRWPWAYQNGIWRPNLKKMS